MGEVARSARPPILRDPRFLRLWVATTASGLATWALPFLLGLAVVVGSLAPSALGLVLAVRTVGFLAVLPVAGVLADRHAPRTVVAVSGGAAAVGSVVLATSLGGPSVVALGAALVVGAGQGACRPAFQALVPLTVGAGQRQAANAAVSVAVRASVLLGPALAGAASAVVDVAWLVGVTATLWLAAAAVPARGRRTGINAGRPPAPAPAGLVADLRGGVAEARRRPWFVAGLGALATVIATGYSVTAVALPLVAGDRQGSGTLLASAATAYTVGALLGGLVMARWRPGAAGWVALGGLGSYATAPATLALTDGLVAVVLAYLVAGVGIELFNVTWFTSLQREVAPGHLSRVSSLDFLVSYGLAPVGLALVVPAVDAVGLQTVLLACAAVCLLAPAIAATVPTTRSFGEQPTVDPNI